MLKNYDINKLASDFIDISSNIIPVIGDGAIFYKDDNNKRVPLFRYIIDSFKKEYPDIQIPCNNRADLFILTCISHEIDTSMFQAKYRRYINDARKAKKIELDPLVLDFLTVFHFPVIITTSCFTYIEEAINKQLSSSKYKPVIYNPKDNNSISLDNSVYHLFGNAEDRFSDWVYNEDMLLEFFHKLHSPDFSCTNLSDYVNRSKSSLMVLDCGLPDWLFRFLWYTIEYPEKKRQGYWLNDNLNIELSHFLENISYSPIDTVTEFLTQTTALKRKELAEEIKQDQPKEYDLFISYAGEDEQIAKKLYDNLLAMGFTVWYDRRGDSEIKAGDKYVAKFAEGIRQSKRAVTIITENYICGVQDPYRGLCEETRLIKQKALEYIAEEKEYSFCIPVLIEGRSFYKKRLDTSFVEQWAEFVTSIEGGLADLFTGTNMHITNSTDPQLPSNI